MGWKEEVMTRKIFKYRVNDEQIVEMPVSARIIHCDLQGDKVTLWAEVPVDVEHHEMDIFECKIVGTGWEIDVEKFKHINTVITNNLGLVWHIYIEGKACVK